MTPVDYSCIVEKVSCNEDTGNFLTAVWRCGRQSALGHTTVALRLRSLDERVETACESITSRHVVRHQPSRLFIACPAGNAVSARLNSATAEMRLKIARFSPSSSAAAACRCGQTTHSGRLCLVIAVRLVCSPAPAHGQASSCGPRRRRLVCCPPFIRADAASRPVFFACRVSGFVIMKRYCCCLVRQILAS